MTGIDHSGCFPAAWGHRTHNHEGVKGAWLFADEVPAAPPEPPPDPIGDLLSMINAQQADGRVTVVLARRVARLAYQRAGALSPPLPEVEWQPADRESAAALAEWYAAERAYDRRGEPAEELLRVLVKAGARLARVLRAGTP